MYLFFLSPTPASTFDAQDPTGNSSIGNNNKGQSNGQRGSLGKAHAMSSFQVGQARSEDQPENLVASQVINTQPSAASGLAELENNDQRPAAASTKNSSIIVVSRGTNEGDPPLWTIVNNASSMNSTVNVFTGTRITHGHPLLLG